MIDLNSDPIDVDSEAYNDIPVTSFSAPDAQLVDIPITSFSAPPATRCDAASLESRGVTVPTMDTTVDADVEEGIEVMSTPMMSTMLSSSILMR